MSNPGHLWADWPGWHTSLTPVKPHLSTLGFVGSHGHNTVTPETDDLDLMGVVIQPVNAYLGLSPMEEFRHMSDWQGWTWDVVVYDIKKFVRLLLKQNPNVLCLLALQDHSYLKKDVKAQQLIANRYLFYSKKVYPNLMGYARAQLAYMKRGLDRPTGSLGAKRKALIEKYGFSVKEAAHVIRLLRMGIEFLSTGEMNVWRPDFQDLVDLKHGLWPLEKVEQEAQRLFGLAEEALVRSPLPAAPDTLKAEQLLVELIRD